MRPVHRIVANGQDITDLLNDRLLLARTVDKPGIDSDEFELRIDDRDGAVALPRKGVKIEVWLGWESDKLTLLGTYTVDEVEVSGPPDTIVIRSKSGETRGSAKETRNGSWEGVTLASIVSDVAKRNNLEPVCTVETLVERADQLGESDINFITRLANQHGCTAKVADGKLIVLQKDGGKSATGKDLPTITIHRTDVSRWQFRFSDDSVKKGARAGYKDKNGDLKVVDVGNDSAPAGTPPVHTDRHLHPNKSAAEASAKARIEAFNRSTASVRLDLNGRTDVFAESKIVAQGFKEGADGEYLVESVEQSWSQSGWTTSIECNAGNNGKADAKGKKDKGPLKVIDVG